MHSFHQSRGRIFFEVLCALGIAASFAGAWLQTGAWAFLPAASVALLYGLVHALDMAGRRPIVAVEPQRIDVVEHEPGDTSCFQDVEVPAAADTQSRVSDSNEEAESAESVASGETGSPRAKAPRKGRGRRSKVSEDAAVAEPTLPEEAEIILPATSEEIAHIPHAPLFEPEPFVRTQRAVFGRKAG